MDGLPKASNKSKYDLDGGGGQVSLLIRLSHKVGGFGSWILGGSVVRFHVLDHGCVALHAFAHDPQLLRMPCMPIICVARTKQAPMPCDSLQMMVRRSTQSCLRIQAVS